MAGAFDRPGELALGFRRDAGDPAGQQFSLLIHEALQELNIFIVDVFAFDFRHDRYQVLASVSQGA